MPQGSVFKQNHPGYAILPWAEQSFPDLENYLSSGDKKQFLRGHYRMLNDVLCLRLSLFLGCLPCWQHNLLTTFFLYHLTAL